MRLEQIATTSRGLDTEAPASGEATGTKDEFMRLLVAQLQHQDPLSPQDSAAFVAQLAQFASIEQSAETNQRLASLEASFSSQERAGYTDLVGKTVTARTDTVKWPAEGFTAQAHLATSASEVEVVIRDSGGNEVKKLSLGARNAGDFDIPWDGTNQSGAKVGDGNYTIEVSAKSSGGASVQSWAQVKGELTALEFLGGDVKFRLGSLTISPADILAVAQTPAGRST